jgi:hypothetical protein
MAAWHKGRPLKRWRYAGVYGEAVMLCAGIVHVAGLPQVFWAVWDRERRRLTERTVVLRRTPGEVSTERVQVKAGAARIDLALEPAGEPVEVVSQHGRAHIWTRKLPVAASGQVWVDGGTIDVEARGLIDESAGYHDRHTQWEWAAGVGTSTDGRALVWNLVAGVHDAPEGSERTVWVDGEAVEVGPARFSTALDSIDYREGQLHFSEEATRKRRDRMLIISSDYVQPFGTFRGNVLADTTIAAGFGVMERHQATW